MRTHVHHRRHPGADADRVVVGDQRLVHRDAVRLGDAGREARPEEHERARGEPGGEHEEPERDARPADDRHALDAVGEPAHRDRAEHEERRRRRGDEDDRALADPERPLDLGPEHVDRRALELVEREQEPEHDEHELAADLERVRERDRLGVDAREQIVGEDDLLAGALVRLLAGVLLVEHRRRERRRAALVALRVRPRWPPTGEPIGGSLVAGSYSVSRRNLWWLLSLRAVETLVFRTETDAASRHFHERGWVIVDAVSTGRGAAPGLGRRDRGARRRRAAGAPTLRAHRLGPQLCRSENFVPSTPACATLLCTGPFVDLAGALLGEPAVLYKEKVNYKLPGGAGYSPHQDAPAYPMIDVHVSAMVAVDDADESNGGLEVVSGCFDRCSPSTSAGASIASVVERSTGSRCRCARVTRSGSTAAHRTAAAPTAPISPAGRSTPPTTPRARATSGPRTTTRSASRSRRAQPGDRARVSLIGDFEGRPV